jgi:hypothetical protein
MKIEDIQPFIFNWKGHFETACRTEESLNDIFEKVIVINSDEENTRPGWVDVGDGAYFGEQFKTLLDYFLPSDHKAFLHIQADATYDRWEDVSKDAVKYFNKYRWGIYAPNVHHTVHTSDLVDLGSINCEDPNLKLCLCTDETVWFVHRDVVEDAHQRGMLDALKICTRGWGWDVVLHLCSFQLGRPVLRDYNHNVSHPEGTGYDKDAAIREFNQLLQDPRIPSILAKLYHHEHKDACEIAKIVSQFNS